MTGPPIIPHSAISPNFDYWQTVLAQYANSPVMMSLIDSMNSALDQTGFFDSLYNNIWNIDTAQGVGLDIWGRIVGVTRNLQIASPVSSTFFGFQEGGWLGFGQGPFFAGGAAGSGASLTTNITLLDNDFRTLILAKAGSNISDGSIRSLNNLLMNLFPGRGTIYVIDNQNMTITLEFLFALTPIEQAILTQQNVLPIPTGVAYSIVQSPPIEVNDSTLLNRTARNYGWIPVMMPKYVQTVGGSVGGAGGSADSWGSLIIPGPMRRQSRW